MNLSACLAHTLRQARAGQGHTGNSTPLTRLRKCRVPAKTSERSEGGGASGHWCPHQGAAPPHQGLGSQDSQGGPTSGSPAPTPPRPGQGASRSPEKAAPRVTQALSPRRGQMRSLTSADRMKGTGLGENKAAANLLFWALCELAPFPASPPLNGPPRPFRSSEGFSRDGEWSAN